MTPSVFCIIWVQLLWDVWFIDTIGISGFLAINVLCLQEGGVISHTSYNFFNISMKFMANLPVPWGFIC